MFAVRRLALSALLIVAAFSASGRPAVAESELVRGIGSTIGTLDPQINFLAWEGWIIDDVYEGLVASDVKGAVIPGAAESWEISDDGLTYTFHLRDGLQWSNGDPLTAQDYVDALIRSIDPATGSDKAYIFYSTIQVAGAADFNNGKSKDPASVGASAPDARTFVLTLASPAPHVLNLAGSFYFAPFHKASYEKSGKDFIKPEHFVGNGPYVIAENVPQSHVALARNPNYWDAANVKIDRIVYRITEDDNTAVKLWEAGDMDVTADIPSERLEALKEKYGAEVRVGASTETNYISFNITKPPFDDIKLRQALSMAIDRETLVNKVVKAGYVVNYGYVIQVPGYDGAKVTEADLAKAERIAKARQLFAEAGFGPDQPLALTIESSNNAAYRKQAETVAVMWKQILGVDAKVNAQDRDAWLTTFNEGGWQVFNDNLVGDFVGPETYLAYMDPRTEAGYSWQSQEYQDLFDQAAKITDQAERYKVLARAEKILLDQYIVAPIASSPNRHLVKVRVKGWEHNPADAHPSRFLSLEE